MERGLVQELWRPPWAAQAAAAGGVLWCCNNRRASCWSTRHLATRRTVTVPFRLGCAGLRTLGSQVGGLLRQCWLDGRDGDSSLASPGATLAVSIAPRADGGDGHTGGGALSASLPRSKAISASARRSTETYRRTSQSPGFFRASLFGGTKSCHTHVEVVWQISSHERLCQTPIAWQHGSYQTPETKPVFGVVIPRSSLSDYATVKHEAQVLRQVVFTLVGFIRGNPFIVVPRSSLSDYATVKHEAQVLKQVLFTLIGFIRGNPFIVVPRSSLRLCDCQA